MGFRDAEFNEFRVVIKNGTVTRETRENPSLGAFELDAPQLSI